MQKILYTNEIAAAVNALAADMHPASVHIVTDTNVAREVLSGLGLPHPVITVPAGDAAKNIDTLCLIWQGLVEGGATRRSLVINIGGGVVTDMGGFAAATFKRGVRFINVPTTLLAAVDAAVGGKTGVNFMGYKNEIGAFAPAGAVVISTATFATLPAAEMRSGYAEMIKHALLSSQADFEQLLGFDITGADLEALLPLLETSVRVKERIVLEDPREQGLRRALNLGHTAGHAFESLALERGCPVPHGYAVAWGTVVEMVLSHMLAAMPTKWLYRMADYLKASGYGVPAVTCDDYPRLLQLMRHDKKNDIPGRINFTLVASPGHPLIDRTAPDGDILKALDIFRDLMGR